MVGVPCLVDGGDYIFEVSDLEERFAN
jgi:hypothetical protein